MFPESTSLIAYSQSAALKVSAPKTRAAAEKVEQPQVKNALGFGHKL